MKKTIIPSIIAKSQKELEENTAKVAKYASAIQLDIMDGKFVRNRSLDFDFKLPKTRCKVEAQLMIKNPEKWIEKNWKKADIIIPSFEGCRNFDDVIELIHKKGKKAGIGINPETSVGKIRKYLGKVEQITVMTVHPGKYGAKFLPGVLKKVRQIRKLKPKLDIEVDGGINPETIKKAVKAGANKFVCGSYIQKAKDVKKAIIILKKRLFR
jgi:ribulose-phosphate 3-epimerase